MLEVPASMPALETDGTRKPAGPVIVGVFTRLPDEPFACRKLTTVLSPVASPWKFAVPTANVNLLVATSTDLKGGSIAELPLVHDASSILAPSRPRLFLSIITVLEFLLEVKEEARRRVSLENGVGRVSELRHGRWSQVWNLLSERIRIAR